jgi:hypothetical protein
MFHLPNDFNAPRLIENDDEPPVHEGLMLVVLFLAIVLVIVGGVLGYFVHGAGFAALLPFVRGDRWQGRGDQPHPGDVAVFLVCVVGFVVLFLSGIL